VVCEMLKPTSQLDITFVPLCIEVCAFIWRADSSDDNCENVLI
jgi:hypothetical protein